MAAAAAEVGRPILASPLVFRCVSVPIPPDSSCSASKKIKNKNIRNSFISQSGELVVGETYKIFLSNVKLFFILVESEFLFTAHLSWKTEEA